MFVITPDLPTIALILLPLAMTTLLINVLISRFRRAHQPPSTPTATIVLTQSPGNHSPRAYAHATALLTSNLTDAVIFISENPPPPPHPNIHFIPLARSTPPARRTTLTLLYKLLHLSRALITALRRAAELPFITRHIIVNTPPALPTLPVVSALRAFLFPCARLTVDCHNLAFSLMALTSPRGVVLAATFAEAISVRLAHHHWTVSTALSMYLLRHFRVRATVVHDRPRSDFVADAHANAATLQLQAVFRDHAQLYAPVDHPVRTVANHVPMIVSSTSWTPDEDFRILLAALPLLEALNRPLLVMLTGKGPQRASFENAVKASQFRNVAVAFAWLPIHQYPALLAKADLGICLHASSSGLDLPMKAVDLLAVGTPVLALRYPCIGELISDGVGGFLFDDSVGLVGLINQLLFQDRLKLARLKDKLRAHMADGNDWLTGWQQNALPTLRQASCGECASRKPA